MQQSTRSAPSRFSSRVFLGFLVLILLLGASFAPIGANAHQLIARQGDVAPGTGGGTFSFFSPHPGIDDQGRVAFWAAVIGGTSTEGVFLHTGNGVLAIAVSGDIAPGTGGGTLILLGPPAMNAQGDIAFSAGVLGSSMGIGSGLFLRSSGQLSTIATSLDAAPGTNGGTYSAFGPILSMNAAGEIAFKGSVSGAGDTSSGIFVESASSSRSVFLRGGPTPASLPGTYFSFGDAAINANGDVVAIAGMSPTVGAFTTGIVGEIGSVDAVVALIGDPAPGTGGGTFSGFSVSATPEIDASENVYFHATVTGGTATSGYFVDSPLQPAAFVLSGQAVPGLIGVDYFAFSTSDLSANDGGLLGFQSTLNSGSLAIFVGTSGATAQMLARTGDVMPGTDGASILLMVNNPSINASGRAAFHVTLSSPSNPFAIVAVPEPGATVSPLAALGALAVGARYARQPGRRRGSPAPLGRFACRATSSPTSSSASRV